MSKRPNAEVADDVIEEMKRLHTTQLFPGINGELCISLIEDGKTKTMSLKSENWRSWLIRFLRRIGVPASASMREEITEALTALAHEVDKEKVYVRVARTSTSVQVDLNDSSFNAVHISDLGGEFRIEQPRDVYLLRTNKQQPLPLPVRCDRRNFVKKFKRLIPSLESGHWLLVLAFILKCLDRDRGAFAILVIGGPQGAGKTVLSFRIKALVDPSEPPFLSPPKNVDDIIVAARNSYLLAYENMSGINSEMADIFCRLSTGGGISKRKLYTDHEEAFYKLHSPIIINGIDEPSNRPDFVDRCVMLELKPIADGERIAETELNKDFEESLPELLGGLYGILAECLHILPNIQINNLPRMTDYARMGIAAEKVLKLRPGLFLREYGKNRDEQTNNTFWNDDLCNAIYSFFRSKHCTGSRIEGTAQELMRRFLSGSRFVSAPRTIKGFSGWLKRIAPLLKSRGIEVEWLPRTASKRLIAIYLATPGGDLSEDKHSQDVQQNQMLVRPPGIGDFRWRKMRSEWEALNGKGLTEVLNETDDL